ncbi:LysR family transcriptional regulator [Arthrobacter sp. LAPM80]|uniref:LysR family transcriptional regulator n=1 Tax=Arthrobacter sp. LAPM80 TaxID=3141788 RepID=UPI00398A99B8
MLSTRMPDIASLEMFVTVLETGSFSAAGKALGLTQQAVSSRMRSLESRMGLGLLQRSPTGSIATEQGTLVGRWAREMLGAAELLDVGAAALRSEGIKELMVAASQTVAEHLLPRWLVELRSGQEDAGTPATIVKLVVSNSAGTIEHLRAGNAALGFVETPFLPADLHSAAVRTDELVLVVCPTHPWAMRKRPVTGAELARSPLVLREEGSGTRDALDQALLAAGTPRQAAPRMELTTTAAVRTAVASGAGPTVMSALAVRDDVVLRRLIRVPVSGIQLKRTITAVWRAGGASHDGPARDLIAIAAHW